MSAPAVESPSETGLSGRAFAGWFLLVWVVTAIPLWILHGVPGVDTPNHVARIHILGNLDRIPEFATFYRAHWTLIPNLGIDLILTPFVKWFNVDALGLMKAFLTLIFGMTAFGFAWLNRGLTGRWSAWGLVGFLFSYSYVLGFGFVNYLFGLALAMLVLGAEVALRDRPLAHRALFMAMPVLLVCHLMAFLLYAIVQIVILLLATPREKKLCSGFLLGLSLSVLVYSQAARGHQRSLIYYDTLGHHVKTLLTPLSYSHFGADVLFQVICLVALGVGLYQRRIGWTQAATVLGLLLFVLALVAPHYAFTSAFINSRIPVFMLLVGLAAVRGPRVGLFVVLLLIGWRTAQIGQRHLEFNATFDAVRSGFRAVPAGSMVFQAAHWDTAPLSSKSWNPSLLHASCYALLERPLFVSNVFTLPSQQPLLLNPALPGEYRDRFPRGDLAAGIAMEVAAVRAYLRAAPGFRQSAYLYFVKPEREVLPRLDAGLGVQVVSQHPRFWIFRVR
jgi:hypothetical protein